jgi:A118 family predicted phage portal protein
MMFQKILSWIRDWIGKMIGKQTIKQAMKLDIAISTPMAEALTLWSQIYENKSPWLSNDVTSLNLGAAIAGEIARSVTIEMEAEFTGSTRSKYLEEQFERVMSKLRHQVEYGAAKGGLIFKPYASDDQVLVDFVQADQFYPVEFDPDGNITSVVFADQRHIGQEYFTRLEYHAMTEDGCEIVNQAYRSNNPDTLGQSVPLDSVDDWATIEPEATITGIDKPLFAYFRYPLANNIDTSSPLGVSCYSRATELIKQADVQWSDLLWEFESGRRALYLDELAFGKDANGKPLLPHKRLYRTLETGSTEGDLYKEWSPDLRNAAIESGLDTILKKIEFNCGLAYGTLSDPQNIDKTATEIKASKQRTYSTIVDTQKALRDALEHLIWAMDTWATIGGLASAGSYDVSFVFDDSVVVDRDTQFQQDLRLVAQGLMSKAEFRMRNFGEKEEVAMEQLAKVEAERSAAGLFPAEE